jgi:putative ABC transport system permease protein
LRNLLVGGEIALAVILLVGASLMFRGFHAILASGEKLEPARLLTLRLALTETKYQEPHQIAGFYSDLLQRLDALPGVRSAAAVTSMPYSGHSNWRNFTIEGRPVDPADKPSAMYQVASPGYFTTARVPLRAGRFLNDGDGPDAPAVALVSDRAVERYWHGKSPLGERIKVADSKQPWMTIVGVVGDVVHNPYDREPRRIRCWWRRTSAPRFAPSIRNSPSRKCRLWRRLFTIVGSVCTMWRSSWAYSACWRWCYRPSGYMA